MDMEAALVDLSREMNALEMEIRACGFALAADAPEKAEAEPRYADTHVGYFSIWE